MMKILVVDDDLVQRLAMLDIISLCGYEVESVSSGQEALTALRANPELYDLVLLDIIMPEMDGIQCLEQIMTDEKLKEIPVVMMSASNDEEFISKSINLGAKNYFYKPIRFANMQELKQYMRSYAHNTSLEAPMLKGIQNYLTIKDLGHGSSGSVYLIKCLSGENKDKLYALKKINKEFLDEQQQKLAENEVQLLKVMVGPTIIRYYESFTTQESISIIMEYADGGSLGDRIEQYKKEGKKFNTELILDWTAQITLGLMLIHIKRIIHRDIKSQNIFLVKSGEEEVVKIGDFGVSKKLATSVEELKTFCGTPYFMSPEQVRGEAYNDKSDMWALGCVIYELVAFNKPFDNDTIGQLCNDIINKEFNPLPIGTDPVLLMLISSLLVKDKHKRPSVWQFSERSEIRKRIEEFVVKHKCADMVAYVLQPDIKELKLPKRTISSEELKADLFSIQMSEEQLGIIVNLLRKNVKVKNVKVGWFSTCKNCISGSELVEGVSKVLGGGSKSSIEVLEKIIDKGMLHNVNGSKKFLNSKTALYRFQMDCENIATNLAWPWIKQYSKPLVVSAKLLIQAINIYKFLLKESKQGTLYIEQEKIIGNDAYTEFVAATAELHGVNLLSLDRKEKLIFFLNVYQCMYIHYLFKHPPQRAAPGIIDRVHEYMTSEKFYYSIAGMDFTLEQIKHGVLRGNMNSPSAYFREFSSSDSRNILPDLNDPRVLLLASDYPELPVQIEVITNKGKLDETLDRITKEFIGSIVCFDDYDRELTLPKIMKKYATDFGASIEERIKWAWNYFTGVTDIQLETVIAGVKNKKIIVHYV